jgi:hypothetical protein
MSDCANDKVVTGLDCKPRTLRLGTMTIAGESAEWAKQQFTELHHAAYQAQGPRAFDDPKSSAVVHEAGHAVLYAHHRIELSSVRVSQFKEGIERGHWTGKVKTVDYLWHTGLDTPPQDDFKNACIQLAGWAAEALFDNNNMRLGSSLDEVIHARLLAVNIAQKTGHDPHQVLIEIFEKTFSILKKNETIVREIAALLDRDGIVRRKALGPILAKVGRPL